MDSQQVIAILRENISAMPALDWFATITGLLYVFLAARENIWCWFFGILSCSTWAYSTLYNYNLYFDALLNVFYVLMGFVGIYQWKYGSNNKNDLKISKMTTDLHLKILVVGTIVGLLFGYFFDEYTLAASTYLDALTTIFAIITTFLVVQKKLENWLYWIVINAVYVYIYTRQGAYLFALNMIIYIIIAISGYVKWGRVMSDE